MAKSTVITVTVDKKVPHNGRTIAILKRRGPRGTDYRWRVDEQSGGPFKSRKDALNAGKKFVDRLVAESSGKLQCRKEG